VLFPDEELDEKAKAKRALAIEIVQKHFSDGLAELCDPHFLAQRYKEFLDRDDPIYVELLRGMKLLRCMKDFVMNRPIQAPIPEPVPVLLYYRVASQRTRQVEYAHIDEVTDLLKRMDLSYFCGRPWKDSGLSPLRVPIAIRKTAAWRSYCAKSVAHREKIIGEMLALGIETKVEKPEEIHD
jgi:hypothetical protein